MRPNHFMQCEEKEPFVNAYYNQAAANLANNVLFLLLLLLLLLYIKIIRGTFNKLYTLMTIIFSRSLSLSLYLSVRLCVFFYFSPFVSSLSPSFSHSLSLFLSLWGQSVLTHTHTCLRQECKTTIFLIYQKAFSHTKLQMLSITKVHNLCVHTCSA